MNGPSTSRSSAPTTGMLTAFVTRPPSSAATTCSATITPARSCASVGRGGEVRRHDDAVELRAARPSTARRRRRRARRRRPCRSAAPRRAPASSTSSPRAAFTIRTPSRIRAIASRVDEAARLVGQRQVEREEVGGREDRVRVVGVLDAELAEALGRDERVVADDAHAEAERATRDLPADPAEAEHAERLVGELDPAPARPLPPALLQRRVRLRDVARERDEQADRVLGGGDDGRVGRVRDDDPAPRRGVDVDVVDPDSGAADHLQPLGALDQLRGQLRRRADDDRVVARRSISSSGESPSTSTSKRERSSSMPGLRDRLPDENSSRPDARRRRTPRAPASRRRRARSAPRARRARARPRRARSRCRTRRTSRCGRSGRSRPSAAPWPPAIVTPWRSRSASVSSRDVEPVGHARRR